MKKIIGNHWFKGAILIALSLTACKQAGYQVLRPDGSVSPENFNGPTSIPPTARVEVLDKGVSVTWIYVGNKVEVRPTLDTLDADYLGKSTCQNPGIIQATYDLGNGSKPEVNRTNCDSLSVKEATFTKAGDYLVQMQVKSQDNEVAWASMTLRVIDKNTPRDQIEGGFTIHAKPLLAGVNQNIAFTGICELKGKLTISWDFADGTKTAGAALPHAYAAVGQYRVTALCTNDAGRSLQASLTIVIVKDPVPTLPDVAVPVPGQNPNIPTNGACDPTQGPCQTGTTQAPGGKPVPTTPTPTWYDTDCTCYYDEYYY